MAIAFGGRPVTAPGWTGRPKTDLALVDCDIHQSAKNPDVLMPYLPRVYQEQVRDQGMRMPGSGYFNVPKRAARTDLPTTPAGVNPGCDADHHDFTKLGDSYEALREAHLDPWNVDRALLTGNTTYSASVIPDPDYAAALCRAFNDWTLAEWAARDERFIGTLLC